MSKIKGSNQLVFLTSSLIPSSPTQLEQVSNTLKEYWREAFDEILSNPKLIDALKCRDTCVKDWINLIKDAWIQKDAKKFRPRAIFAMYMYNCLNPNATKQEQRCNVTNSACLELFEAARRLTGLIVDGALEFKTNVDLPSSLECYSKQTTTLAMNDVVLLNSIAASCFNVFRKEQFFANYCKIRVSHNKSSLLGDIYVKNCKELKSPDICTFKMYEAAVKVKYSEGLFIHPFQTAMVLCGIDDKLLFDQVGNLGTKIGLLHQIQLEYFYWSCDEPKQRVKCNISSITLQKIPTWFEIKAYQLTKTEAQKSILMNQSDEEYSIKVKKLLNELQIAELFLNYKEELLPEIAKDISGLHSSIPKEPFNFALNIVINNKNIEDFDAE